MKTYSTSEIAGIIGIHPNTVMLYEKWGYIAPVERKENGYRVYTETHLEQMKLVRMALRSNWIKYYMKFEVQNIIRCAARGELQKALEYCCEYLEHIQNEKNNELKVMRAIYEILKNDSSEEKDISLNRNEAAKLLGVTINVIINWERNGLIEVPRSNNGYRVYGEDEIKRLRVIKALRQENYRTQCICRMLAGDAWLISFMPEAERDAKEMICYIEELISRRRNV